MTVLGKSHLLVTIVNSLLFIEQHFFRVTCLKLGDVPLRVAIGNGASPTNPNPAKEEATSQLSCAEPHTLKVKPKFDTKLECPLLQSSSSNIQVCEVVTMATFYQYYCPHTYT